MDPGYAFIGAWDCAFLPVMGGAFRVDPRRAFRCASRAAMDRSMFINPDFFGALGRAFGPMGGTFCMDPG
jgi:hypothetical protein